MLGKIILIWPRIDLFRLLFSPFTMPAGYFNRCQPSKVVLALLTDGFCSIEKL